MGRRIPVTVRSAALWVVAAAAILFLLDHLKEVLIPISLSLLIAYALDPIVTTLHHWRIPRALGAAVLLLTIIGALGWFTYTLRDDMANALERIPAAAKKIRHSFQQRVGNESGAIEKVQKAAAEVEKTAERATRAPGAPETSSDAAPTRVQEPSFKVLDFVWWGSMGAMAMAGQFILIVFLVYFILIFGDLYRRKLIKMAGSSATGKAITVDILDEINGRIGRFLLALIFTNLIVGISSWLAFRWIGLEHAGVWGMVAGVLNSIPYVGPIAVAGGLALVGFFQFGVSWSVALLVGVSLAITTLEGYLLTPWLTSQAGRMNALAVFVGLLFWGWVWGMWGLLLAVPILIVVKAVCDHFEGWMNIGELLSE